MRELEGPRLTGVADEGDVNHRLGAIPGSLTGSHPLRVSAMAVDGQVLAEQVDVVQRSRGGDQLRADLSLARPAGRECRDRASGELEQAVRDLDDWGVAGRAGGAAHACWPRRSHVAQGEVDLVNEQIEDDAQGAPGRLRRVAEADDVDRLPVEHAPHRAHAGGQT